jgi:tRNA threonylcarbamoyladenosine biosynthesis protein TsaB
MKLVAIESATAASSVALGDGQAVVAAASREDRRGHAEFLAAALDFCLDQAGWTPSELEGVVVDVGPGLYTGIRVGLATAQGLAAALGIPIVPATSLDAIALRAATGRRHIHAVVDVRRGEVATASYRPVPGGVVRDDPPALTSIEELRASLQSDPDDVLLVGDRPALGEGFLNGLHRVKVGRPRYPAAEALLELAASRLAHDDVPHPDEIRPLYLRDANVTISSVHRDPTGPWGDIA